MAEEITPMDAYFRKLFGKKNIPSSENKVLEHMKKAEEQRKTSPSAKELEGFIYVPSINLYLSKEVSHKGKSWNECHEILSKEDAFMPTIYHFKEFLKYMRENPNGTNDASGSEIETILDEILTVRDPWRAEWLDAKFEKRKDGLYLLTKQGSPEKLTDYLDKTRNPGIDLDDWLENANSQGLPSSKTKDGKLYYYAPVDGRVARFDADSDGAYLGCDDGVPVSRSDSLGVRRATAEGGSQKTGGRK